MSPACKVIAISATGRILSDSATRVYNTESDCYWETDEQY